MYNGKSLSIKDDFKSCEFYYGVQYILKVKVKELFTVFQRRPVICREGYREGKRR